MAKRCPLGNRIAAACGLRNVSMTQLANDIGIASNSLSRIVRGDIVSPRAEVVVKIAKRLRVSTDYLLSLSDELIGGHGLESRKRSQAEIDGFTEDERRAHEAMQVRESRYAQAQKRVSHDLKRIALSESNLGQQN